jgi:hypothetical protein
MMNLGDLANLGQIIGAIGVFITLIYLALQIPGSAAFLLQAPINLVLYLFDGSPNQSAADAHGKYSNDVALRPTSRT